MLQNCINSSFHVVKTKCRLVKLNNPKVDYFDRARCLFSLTSLPLLSTTHLLLLLITIFCN